VTTQLWIGGLQFGPATYAGTAGNNNQNQRVVIYTKSSGSVTNKRTNQAAVMKPAISSVSIRRNWAR